MKGKVVRVSENTHVKLKEISQTTGETISNILEKAVENYRRKEFLKKTNKAYAKLKEDKEKWEEELSERKDWDLTLLDGLEDDD
ncbi:MAG: ribbon-helix-helix domain-containing protein [Kosmotogaceae bacterium]